MNRSQPARSPSLARKRVLATEHPDAAKARRLRVQRETLAMRKQGLLDALTQSMGLLTQALRATGCTYKEFVVWRTTDPDFKEALAAVDQQQVDFVEGKLMSLINQNSERAILFYLASKGHVNGYKAPYRNNFIPLPEEAEAARKDAEAAGVDGAADDFDDVALVEALKIAAARDPSILTGKSKSADVVVDIQPEEAGA